MEIEIGEYIRTNTGLILKYDDKNEKAFIDNFLMCPNIMKERISNHSKNIIDLIEVGDYINLERVLDITEEYIRTTERIHNKYWLSNNIRSIVTEEQFEKAEYRIPEEK